MTKNPERRLGYDNEELNIKRHHFFAPIDWAKLERREIKPEFVPDGSKLNFEKDFTEEEPTLRIVFKIYWWQSYADKLIHKWKVDILIHFGMFGRTLWSITMYFDVKSNLILNVTWIRLQSIRKGDLIQLQSVRKKSWSKLD